MVACHPGIFSQFQWNHTSASVGGYPRIPALLLVNNEVEFFFFFLSKKKPPAPLGLERQRPHRWEEPLPLSVYMPVRQEESLPASWIVYQLAGRDSS
jgi:hypothetical protein